MFLENLQNQACDSPCYLGSQRHTYYLPDKMPALFMDDLHMLNMFEP